MTTILEWFDAELCLPAGGLLDSCDLVVAVSFEDRHWAIAGVSYDDERRCWYWPDDDGDPIEFAGARVTHWAEVRNPRYLVSGDSPRVRPIRRARRAPPLNRRARG